MDKSYFRRIAPIALVTTILLSGCGEKSECDIPTRHVHRYTKSISDEIQIETYRDSETLYSYGYNWNEDYIEINKVDEEFYRVIGNKGLFEGDVNWPYLFNKMAEQEDYLMYFYEYDQLETYTVTDSDGNVQVKTRIVHHSGWHSNAYDSDNTGLVRLYHHKFFGYRVVNKNGKFKLEQSPIVDDIRQVINDYPYFSEKPVTEVYQEFRFNKYELGDLKPEDFDTFVHPDLDHPELEVDKLTLKVTIQT